MIKSVPTGYALTWIKASMAIAKKNYSLFLACSVLTFFIVFLVSLVPFIGQILAAPLSFILMVASLRFMRQFLAGSTMTFENFLNLATDKDALEKHKMYLIIIVGLSLFQTALQLSVPKIGVLALPLLFPLSLIAAFFTPIAVQAAFMQYTDSNLDWQAALKRSFSGMLQNAIPTFLVGLLLSLFAGLSALFCLLPFILYFIPMVFPVSYLYYCSIFEGLDIDQVLAEWQDT